MSTNTNEPKDGAGVRERAVAEGDALRTKAVEHAREVGGAVGLAEAPVSADAPPPYPAPPVPAPPYPARGIKATMPATPRALARQVAEALQPVSPIETPAEAPPTPIAAAQPPVTETATSAPVDKPGT